MESIAQITMIVFWLGGSISIFVPFALASWRHQDNLKEAWWILVTVAVLCTLLTVEIFSILDVAVDTIFLCILEDYERNDGSDARPYFMTQKLSSYVLNE